MSFRFGRAKQTAVWKLLKPGKIFPLRENRPFEIKLGSFYFEVKFYLKKCCGTWICVRANTGGRGSITSGWGKGLEGLKTGGVRKGVDNGGGAV